MCRSKAGCFLAIWAFLLIAVAALPSHAMQVEFENEIYTFLPLKDDGAWGRAISTLRGDRSSKQSWESLEGKAQLFENMTLTSRGGKQLTAWDKAELLALSDMVTEITSTGGQPYVDALDKAKSGSYWGAFGMAASDAIARVGVPLAGMANKPKEVRVKDIVELGIEVVKLGSDINAMAYGVALGNEYMTMAQDYAARLEKGKERARAGEVLDFVELTNLHIAAQNAKAYGVIGSQISTIASTMNRDGFADVASEHWAALVSTCLGAASEAFDQAKGAADTATSFGAGAFSDGVFIESLKKEGVPADIAKNIVKKSDLVGSLLKDTQKAIEMMGDLGAAKSMAQMLGSGLRGGFDDLNPNDLIGKNPIFDEELLAIYEMLFDEGTISPVVDPEENEYPVSLNPSEGSAEYNPSPSSSSSSGPRLGDISIDSNVGDVTVINKTRRDLEVNIHSVEAQGNAKTGDITIKSGRGNDVTVIKGRRRDESEVNIGSVQVGD